MNTKHTAEIIATNKCYFNLLNLDIISKFLKLCDTPSLARVNECSHFFNDITKKEIFFRNPSKKTFFKDLENKRNNLLYSFLFKKNFVHFNKIRIYFTYLFNNYSLDFSFFNDSLYEGECILIDQFFVFYHIALAEYKNNKKEFQDLSFFSENIKSVTKYFFITDLNIYFKRFFSIAKLDYISLLYYIECFTKILKIYSYILKKNANTNWTDIMTVILYLDKIISHINQKYSANLREELVALKSHLLFQFSKSFLSSKLENYLIKGITNFINNRCSNSKIILSSDCNL